jgi:hypothetical protein
MSNGYRIPPPPGQPNFHLYSAGSPGDYRPISERLAERIEREHFVTTPRLTREHHNLITLALKRAFEAGRAYERECGHLERGHE